MHLTDLDCRYRQEFVHAPLTMQVCVKNRKPEGASQTIAKHL